MSAYALYKQLVKPPIFKRAINRIRQRGTSINIKCSIIKHVCRTTNLTLLLNITRFITTDLIREFDWFNIIIEYSAIYGCLPMLKWCMQYWNGQYHAVRQAMYKAVEYCRNKIVRYLLHIFAHDNFSPDVMVKRAAISNNYYIAKKYINDIDHKSLRRAIYNAIFNRDMYMMMILLVKYGKPDDEMYGQITMRGAHHGCIDIVKWAIPNVTDPTYIYDSFVHSCIGRHPDITQYIMDIANIPINYIKYGLYMAYMAGCPDICHKLTKICKINPYIFDQLIRLRRDYVDPVIIRSID